MESEQDLARLASSSSSVREYGSPTHWIITRQLSDSGWLGIPLVRICAGERSAMSVPTANCTKTIAKG
jgi:hypothetical protein